MIVVYFLFFFFKQKTAYEMRISDWSSDVCSSDLRAPYETTGRWTDYGDELFRLRDRKQVDYMLGPTHEEMFTLLVKDLCSSCKDLPLSIYQIDRKSVV